tara:strand:+ start:810 stop:1304 length:495 start_codon:yes stop_codon:yes gene_type:complete
MKITRQQLRRIIKEATVSGGSFEQRMAESTLALKYIAEYIRVLHNVIQHRLPRENSGMARATHEFFHGPVVKKLQRMADNVEADIPESEYVAAKDEARADAKAPDETIQQKIDNLDMYLYSQSPIGMSYVEAMRTYMFGEEDRGTADSIMQWFEDNSEWLEGLE